MLNAVYVGLTVLCSLSLLSAQAEVLVEKLDLNEIPVRLDTELSSTSSKIGDPVKVTLPEDIILDDKRIPAFSTLEGRIEKIRHADRIGRYAFTQMTFTHVCMPSENTGETPAAKEERECYLLEDAESLHQANIFPYYPDKSFKTIVKRQAPIEAASLAVSIPLAFAGHLGFFLGWGIEHAAGAAASTAQDVMNKKNNHSIPYKVGEGAVRSTGIPFWYELASKGKDFDYPTGIVLHMHFEPKVLEEVAVKTNAHKNVYILPMVSD